MEDGPMKMPYLLLIACSSIAAISGWNLAAQGEAGGFIFLLVGLAIAGFFLGWSSRGGE